MECLSKGEVDAEISRVSVSVSQGGEPTVSIEGREGGTVMGCGLSVGFWAPQVQFWRAGWTYMFDACVGGTEVRPTAAVQVIITEPPTDIRELLAPPTNIGRQRDYHRCLEIEGGSDAPRLVKASDPSEGSLQFKGSCGEPCTNPVAHKVYLMI